VGAVQPVCEWVDVSGAVEPTTGARFFRAWPSLHAERCQLLIEAFAQAFPDRHPSPGLDTSGAPTSAHLTRPENRRLRFLPPYGPALNPSERLWRDLKDDMAWLQCAAIEAPQDELSRLLQGDEAATLQSLTGYPDLVEALHARHV